MAEKHEETKVPAAAHDAAAKAHDTVHAVAGQADAATDHAAATAHEAVVGVADSAHEAVEHHFPRAISEPPELPHFVGIWFEHEAHKLEHEGKNPFGDPGGPYTLAQTLHVGRRETPAPFVDYAPWENNLFAGIAAGLLLAVFWLGTSAFRRNREDALRRPTRGQVAMEGLVEGVQNFCASILGEKNGKIYMPYVAGLFFFVLAMNLMGMIPFMKAPTSSVLITASLAICTFFVYMYTAMVKLGPGKFILHLMGDPKSLLQWVFAPLILAIELISWFFAKPLSLALRLFGNILGKDILFGVALMLGISMVGQQHGVMGAPLTYPFYFLGLLLSAVQAMIFALLSAIYVLLVLPHDDHHDEHGHDDHGHGHKKHAH